MELDMIVTKSFESPEELAKFSEGKTAVYLLVGSCDQCGPLAEQLAPILLESEVFVRLETDAEIFKQMENANSFPALGVWSSKGSLIGYRENDESVAEFVKYSRKYC